MKDGEAFTSKYGSKQLKTILPNVAMVFSNPQPDVRELAKERVRMFYISNKQLERKTMLR